MAKTKSSHIKRSDQRRPAPITQHELARFLELTEQSKQQDKLRKDIVSRLERGADVEQGQLTTELTIKHMRTWSKEKVAEVIGLREAQHILNLLQPTPYRRLHVFNSEEQSLY